MKMSCTRQTLVKSIYGNFFFPLSSYFCDLNDQAMLTAFVFKTSCNPKLFLGCEHKEFSKFCMNSKAASYTVHDKHEAVESL